MADINMSELYEAFYNIPPKSYDYCCICLRLGSERKLFEPNAFAKLIQVMQTDWVISNNALICYICEEQARAAYKFCQAVAFANRIRRFLSAYLGRKKVKCDKVLEYKRFKGIFQTKYELTRCEEELHSVRRNSKLMPTEVLVIDTTVPNVEPVKSSVVGAACDIQTQQSNIKGLSEDIVIILDEEDNSEITQTESINTQKRPTIHSKPLKNKSETQTRSDPHNIATSISYNTKIITKATPSIGRNSLSTNLKAVPSMNNNIINCDTTPSIGTTSINIDLMPSMNENAILTPSIDMNCVLQPVLLQTIDKILVPILTMDVAGNQVIKLSQMQTVNSDTKMVSSENVQANIDTNCIVQEKETEIIVPEHDLTDCSQDIDSIAREIVNALRPKEMSSGQAVKRPREMCPVISNVKSVADCEMKHIERRPPRADTDWEDKIPMDVISFMDAIDPNAPKLPKIAK